MLVIFSVVPSPYQRDFFLALSEQLPNQLRVYYLEKSAPDSPWPEEPLRAFEMILPGICLGRGRVRCHVNWRLPTLEATDVILVNLPLTAVTAQWLARRLGRKFKWYYWGELMRRHSARWKNQAQKLLFLPLKRCRGIFAIGRAAATDYRRRLHTAETPVWNLPYSCDLKAFRQGLLPKNGGDETIFLFCGQMIPRKGIDVLLNAFALLIQEGVRSRLLLSGREADLPRRLEKMPPSARELVEYVGFTAPENLPALFARADVFVLPSRHDGWGVVINQALGASLPVIGTTTTGAAAELIEDGKNGFLIPPDDVSALAAAMKKLAQGAELRCDMGKAAGQSSRQLEPEVQAKRLMDFIGG